MNERQQLEQAIAAQESLRGTLDDAIIDATIATLKEKLAALESPHQQQRKQVTVLFMDVVGSTDIIRDLDPEENLAIMDTALKKLSAPVEEHNGHVTRYMGDGFKAIFGAPVARENDPEMAVRAGLGILAASREYAGEVEAQWGIQGFIVRVGINTGLAIIGGYSEAEDTIMGAVVNLAARLESAAEPGTILISHDSYKHVRGIFDFEPLQPIQAKGFPEPIPVYRVLRAKAHPFYRGVRGVEGVETRMVGREAEFMQLQQAFHEVISEGERQMVTLVGEAGLGKSRLLYEFENWVDLQPQTMHLYKGRARLETQGIPYSLLRDLFAFRFRIQDDDRSEAVRGKLVEGFQEALGPDERGEMKSHIVGQLLGYDFSQSPHMEGILDEPQQLRDRALTYIRDYFQAISNQESTLLLLEDLHWSDDSSLDALNNLTLGLSGEPVLFLAAARPSLYEKRPNWMEGQPFHLRLDLRPLSRWVSRQLVKEVLQKVDDIPATLRELVVSNAEGNPFYVEELVKMLIEDGVIIRGDPHWRVEASRLEEVHVPPTLTGVLQARLDSLPLEERTVLQQASVVGRVFWDQALERISEAVSDAANLSTSLQNILDDLRGRELIFRRETSAFTDTREHIFKHALLREVTYESVLKRVRQTYHAMIAEWLIDHVGDREGEFLGQIANHLVLAQNPEKALVYLRKAGEEAAARFANEEAISYFSQALALAKQIGVNKEELELLYTRIGRTRELNSQWDLALETYKEMEQYSHLCGDRNLELASLIAQIVVHAVPTPLHNPTRAYPLAEKALNLARELNDQAAEAKILWGLCIAHYFEGDFSQSIDAGERSLVLARKLNLREQLAQTLNDLGGLCYAYGGRIDQAVEALEEAIYLWRELGNVPMLTDSLSALCNVYVIAGKYPQAIALSEEALQISQSSNNVWGQSYCQYSVGRAYWERGEVSQAIRVMEESIRLGELSGFTIPQAYTRADLATVFGNLGALDLAFETTKQASDPAERDLYEAYTQGVFAHLYVLSGDLSKAEAIIEKYTEHLSEISKDYLNTYIPIIFADIELALGKSNFDYALDQLAVLLKVLRKSGMLSQVPNALYLQAQALRGLDQIQKARGRLLEARVEAESIGSHWMLWMTLATLSQHEPNPSEAERLRKEASKYVESIADHIDQPELQASFLNLPEVQALYG